MKVYAIICHKGKKPKLQLRDEVVYIKKADAKKRLKDDLKDLEKKNEATYYKDSDSYIVTKTETGTEYTMYIEELELL